MIIIDEIKLVINREVMGEYKDYYFKKYPKRKVFPFENKKGVINPIPPSLNKFMVMLRPQANDTKQKWKDFAIWLANKHKLHNAQIDNCEITYTTYMPTKRRFDLDNTVISSKLLSDGFVECGMIIDDDAAHIKKLSLVGGYDKDDPRLVICIKLNH